MTAESPKAPHLLDVRRLAGPTTFPVLISRRHEFRLTTIYHGGATQRIERLDSLTCMDCGFVKQRGARTYVPCRRKGESPTSGFAGVLIDARTGTYLGRFRMAGRHPITGKPFAQWSYAKEPHQ